MLSEAYAESLVQHELLDSSLLRGTESATGSVWAPRVRGIYRGAFAAAGPCSLDPGMYVSTCSGLFSAMYWEISSGEAWHTKSE